MCKSQLFYISFFNKSKTDLVAFTLINTSGFATTHVVVSVGHPITYLSPHPIPYQRESSLKISPCRQGFAVPEELGNKQTKNTQTDTLTDILLL